MHLTFNTKVISESKEAQDAESCATIRLIFICVVISLKSV